MKYDQPEVRTLLAGKYVLGLLRGRTRERFERLLMGRTDLVREVTAWEERFAPLMHAVAPVEPPRRVWRRIRRALRRNSARERASADRRRRGGFVLAGVAAAAFFVMLGLYLSRPAPLPAPSQVAVIATQQGAPQWVINVRDHRMQMRTVGQVAPPANKSYELWMLPGNGAKPVSLGLLPASGEASEKLSPEMLKALRSAKGLAVSIEPEGGSPTGLPTGPVVFTTKLAHV
jgi:anti-sigma-K factor RskA